MKNRFELFQRIAAKKRNVVYSPYGAITLLDCIDRIHLSRLHAFSFLTGSYDQDDLNKEYPHFFNSVDHGYYPITQDDSLKENSYFICDEECLPFLLEDCVPPNFKIDDGLNLDKIRGQIVEDTGGLIRNFPSNKDLESSDMVFLNNIFLNIKWLKRFTPKNDQKFTFHGINRKTYKPDYLTLDNLTTNCFNSQLLTIVEITTVDPNYSAYLFRPNEDISLEYLVKHLDTFYPLINSVEQRFAVGITLPKFNFEQEIDLKEILQNMGVESIFKYSKNWNHLDWDKLLDDAEVKVGLIKQKNKVVFDEEEIKAGSSTLADIVVSGCIFPPKPLDIVFDKPFFYSIVHKPTKQSIFMGTVEHFE